MPTLPRPFPLRPIAAAMLLYSAVAYGADSADDSNVFQIGKIETIEIKGSKPSGIPDAFGADSISAQSMQDNFALDVGQALSNVTGVAPTSTGQRAESQVYIRGFNQNQVTLSVDGIPIYVPYDGNVDLSRLLTANLSEIVVTKGLGSLMYGPNNMGGTINLITKRPDKPFALDVSGGLIGNQDGIDANNGSAQFGSRLNDRWYVTGGFAFNNSTGFPLSGDFTPVAAQPSGARLNATSHAQNYNFKVGFTPNATDEYALAVSEVISMKQDPPYTGNTAVTGQKAAYWDWPQWNKQSYYFIGNTGIGAGYLKTRIYLDRFINQLDSYDNATYSTTFKPYAFNSEYNDHSEGVNLEFGQPLGSANLLKLAGFYKQDVHTETQFPSNAKLYDSPWLYFQAQTFAFGVEDTWSPSQSTRVVTGYRHDRHQFDDAQVYTNNLDTAVKNQPISDPAQANNWQITVQHDLGADIGAGDAVLRAGIGSKTRFPGIKDVYSYSLGKSIPNPTLGPERAQNREIGVSGSLGTAHYDAALFWDSISDAIQAVSISPGLTQNQNVATATNKGLDLNLQQELTRDWLGTLHYSHLDRTLGTSGLVATGTPTNRGELIVTWTASASVEAAADVQANSRIQTATNGLQPVAGNAIADLRVTGHLSKELTLNAGIGNLFDRNYAFTEGFPMPGRTFKLQLNYRL